MVFVYQKTDCPDDETSKLNILHAVFVSAERTADYQTTTGLVKILENNGNKDDIQAFLLERMLPVDEIGVNALSEEILDCKPEIGYLTISNALQWRLQYNRIIKEAGNVKGILKVK